MTLDVNDQCSKDSKRVEENVFFSQPNDLMRHATRSCDNELIVRRTGSSTSNLAVEEDGQTTADGLY